MRELARQLAEDGFRVFPVGYNSKVPAIKDWPNKATDDVSELFKLFPHDRFNVGIATAGLVVVDADKDKGGLESLERLIRDFNLPETLTFSTARGGNHVVFKAPEGMKFKSSACKKRCDGRWYLPIEGYPGLDIRADGGYIVAPGSVFEGKPYTIENDVAPVTLPSALAERLSLAVERSTEPLQTLGEVDGPIAMKAAIEYLTLAAPLATEGAGGDQTTYDVANRVFDFGISQETALELMTEQWNERCSPPWDSEDLEKKIRNAFTYREDPIGRDNPERFGDMFGAIEHPPEGEPTRCDSLRGAIKPLPLSYERMKSMPRRPWLVDRLLLRKKLSVLVAPGGVGKSTLTLQWAAGIALGDGRFTGIDVREQSKVLMLNSEDEPEEMERRLYGVALKFGLPLEELDSMVLNLDAALFDFKLLERRERSLKIPTAVNDLIHYMKQESVGALFLDPLVEAHEVEENDNGGMARVAHVLKRVASATNAAVLVVHHTRKPPEGSSDGHAGNMDSARGSSSVMNAARIGLTLCTASAKDMTKAGRAAEERHKFVRLDEAKGNLFLKSPRPQWYERASVPVGGNGEAVGVLAPVDLAANPEQIALREIVYRLVCDRYQLGETKAVPVTDNGSGAASLLNQGWQGVFEGCRRECPGPP